MAVYLPLSVEAQDEARELMVANKNLLKPQNGDPIANPRMDMVLGAFWMTKGLMVKLEKENISQAQMSAITAYEYGVVSLQNAKIKVLATDTPKYKTWRTNF